MSRNFSSFGGDFSRSKKSPNIPHKQREYRVYEPKSANRADRNQNINERHEYSSYYSNEINGFPKYNSKNNSSVKKNNGRSKVYTKGRNDNKIHYGWTKEIVKIMNNPEQSSSKSNLLEPFESTEQRPVKSEELFSNQNQQLLRNEKTFDIESENLEKKIVSQDSFGEVSTTSSESSVYSTNENKKIEETILFHLDDDFLDSTKKSRIQADNKTNHVEKLHLTESPKISSEASETFTWEDLPENIKKVLEEIQEDQEIGHASDITCFPTNSHLQTSWIIPEKITAQNLCEEDNFDTIFASKSFVNPVLRVDTGSTFKLSDIPENLAQNKCIKSSPNSPIFSLLVFQKLSWDYDAKEWFYIDLENNIQGPFSGRLLDIWFSRGYLPLNLNLTIGTNNDFKTLKHLIEIVQRKENAEYNQKNQEPTTSSEISTTCGTFFSNEYFEKIEQKNYNCMKTQGDSKPLLTRNNQASNNTTAVFPITQYPQANEEYPLLSWILTKIRNIKPYSNSNSSQDKSKSGRNYMYILDQYIAL